MWAHSRLAAFGVHRSDKAHQRVDLSQSIQLPSLIRAEERAIVRAIGTQDRFAPVVRAPAGDPYWIISRDASLEPIFKGHSLLFIVASYLLPKYTVLNLVSGFTKFSHAGSRGF
jgi:hypothetical protein